MDAQAEETFREFVAGRSAALLRTAVLLTGGDRHAAEDLLQTALVKAAGRWSRIDEPLSGVREQPAELSRQPWTPVFAER